LLKLSSVEASAVASAAAAEPEGVPYGSWPSASLLAAVGFQLVRQRGDQITEPIHDQNRGHGREHKQRFVQIKVIACTTFSCWKTPSLEASERHPWAQIREGLIGSVMDRGSSQSGAPVHLATLLRQHRDDLIQIWGQRVLADPRVPEANGLTGPALVDHLPELIDRMIRMLDRGAAEGERGEQMGRAAGQGDESRAHADDRLAAEYGLPSALRELSHLRVAILQLAVREHAQVPSQEWLLLHADLDEVMALSAVRLHEAAQAQLRAGERRLQEALAREEALRRAAEQNETELRRLSEMGMLGVIVGTRDGDLIEANDAFLDLVGHTRQELAAGRLRWRDMTPPESRRADERALELLDRTGVAQPYEKVFLRRDGTPVDVLLGSATLPDGRLVAFVLDITARKAAEAALAEVSRERDASLSTLETFMASAPVGFAVVDREFRYVRINETLARMNGPSVAQHVGRRIREVMPAFADQLEAVVRQPLESRRPLMGLHFEVGQGDSQRHMLASYHPLCGPDGEVYAVGGVVVDITEQKRAEIELRKDAELRERFMAILGHDLRSPLSAILLGAQALLRSENLPPGFVRTIQRVKNSARRADRLVSDLVDLVRSRQGGGIPILRRPTDLQDVCEDVVAEVNAAYPDRRIDLVSRGGTDGRWDPDRVAQLAANLVTNAVLYSPPDTTVTAEVGGRDAQTVFLRVHNQGAPIPAEMIPVIFDPFRRGLPGSSAQMPRGLGLGLHIAQQIARAHGGDIQVESCAKAGTTFTVILPRDATR
jgi:PAS domain S-box-containing protein